MEARISIITLGVSDLERSRTFYRDGLALPMRAQPSEGIAFFETGATWLSLFPRESLAADANLAAAGSGFAGFALAHNVREKQEVEPTLAQAVAAGAKLLKPAEEPVWGGYSGYFADPDGYAWEVAWNPHFPIR